MSLSIIIIGAGLGGLAAAVSIKSECAHHNVLVLESAPQLAEIGAGLQLTPNATRILERWGLSDILANVISKPQTFSIHRYSDGLLLGKRENYGEEMLSKYKSNFWDIHRADLQLALYHHAERLGVKFRFGVSVEGHDFVIPEVLLSTGEAIRGDLIVAADGLWSKTRSSFLGRPSPPLPTGDLAYRILLETKDIYDEDLRIFASIPRVCLWVGPECHAIYYPLKGNTMLNIVLLVPDNLPDSVAKAPGSLQEMHEIFKDWDPRLQKLLGLVDKVDKWKLMHLDEMDKWHNDTATVVFLGDACHPMLPYMAQGAGSSLEDGAALGLILAKIDGRADLLEALKKFERVRKSRSLALQQGSLKQRHVNHLRNGPEQVARDQLCLDEMDDPQPGYPFYWIDPKIQSYVYGYDVFAELE
ncbi:hypothetical protein LTR84_000194 [Exophiala bonariae]|uniref:FAD-binding domain-containing protein n=1 Tax=Exophiala bonariae TaxID=1690606 RepID=A0AAV9NQL0_9EURO|nr:hypothetical protein LTR84_000194 [Exophiala bonariae]